jgi:type I restriction enzyme S subunit
MLPWKSDRLGSLCDVLDSKRKPITKRHRVAGPFPYYGATGVLDHVAGYLFDEPLVLVGEDGAKWGSGESTAFPVQGKVWVNNHAHVLRPHRDAILDSWLIYHLNHLDLAPFVTGLTVPKLNQGNLVEIPVPVPPLAEQQRIVGILDEAFEGIATAKANAEQNLRNARALFESHLYTVFEQSNGGWSNSQLGDVCEFEGGSQPPKAEFVHTPRTGYIRFLQIRDFGSEKHITFIPDSKKNRVCTADDILIGRYGASVGKILTGKAGSYNVALMKATPDSTRLDRRFFYHYLRSGAFQDRLKRVASRSAQDGFGKEDIFGFPVPVPALDDQRSVVLKFEPLAKATQRLSTVYENKLEALEAMKRSLLNRAFTGQL